MLLIPNKENVFAGGRISYKDEILSVIKIDENSFTTIDKDGKTSTFGYGDKKCFVIFNKNQVNEIIENYEDEET